MPTTQAETRKGLAGISDFIKGLTEPKPKVKSKHLLVGSLVTGVAVLASCLACANANPPTSPEATKVPLASPTATLVEPTIVPPTPTRKAEPTPTATAHPDATRTKTPGEPDTLPVSGGDKPATTEAPKPTATVTATVTATNAENTVESPGIKKFLKLSDAELAKIIQKNGLSCPANSLDCLPQVRDGKSHLGVMIETDYKDANITYQLAAVLLAAKQVTITNGNETAQAIATYWGTTDSNGEKIIIPSINVFFEGQRGKGTKLFMREGDHFASRYVTVGQPLEEADKQFQNRIGTVGQISLNGTYHSTPPTQPGNIADSIINGLKGFAGQLADNIAAGLKTKLPSDLKQLCPDPTSCQVLLDAQQGLIIPSTFSLEKAKTMPLSIDAILWKDAIPF